MPEHISNARIASTMLGWEDHGILTCYLMLELGGGGGQGFGGWALDAKPKERSATAQREPHAICGAFVAGILRAVGVEKWEALKGQHVRVKRDGNAWGPIIAIGHIIDDRWFSPGDTGLLFQAGG